MRICKMFLFFRCRKCRVFLNEAARKRRENIILNSRRTPEKCVEAVVKRLKFIIEQARNSRGIKKPNRSRTGRKTQRSGREAVELERKCIYSYVYVYILVCIVYFLFNGL